MNQAITYMEYTAPAEHQAGQGESLLDKIRVRIGRALRASRNAAAEGHRPVTFIETHLLDPELGPEISRTLR